MVELPTNDLAKLGKYGIVGVLLSLVGAIVISIYFIYSLATNHIATGNEINMKLTNAVTELSTIIKLPNRISKN